MGTVEQIHSSIQRAAERGWRALEFQVMLQSSFLKSNLSESCASAGDVQSMLFDEIACSLYPNDGPENLKPVQIYGDGNCFYRAISKAAFGTEDRHLELRLRTIFELVSNTKKYLSDDTYRVMCTKSAPNVFQVVHTSVSDESLVPTNLEKSLQNEIVKSVAVGEYCSLIHIFATVNSLGRPIHSIYPLLQNAGVNRDIYHQRIIPRDGTQSGQPIYLMWTHTENKEPVNWTPNHFVVCFPESMFCRDTPTECSNTGIDHDESSIDENEPPSKRSKCSDNGNTSKLNDIHLNQKEDTVNSSSSVMTNCYDIGNVVNGSISLNSMKTAEKLDFIKKQPSLDSLSTLKRQPVSKRKSGHQKTKMLSFQPSWAQHFKWLTYSECMGGGMCMVCVLFPQRDMQHQDTFVTRPFTSYKKALGKDSYLQKHEHSEHHRHAKRALQTARQSLEEPSTTLPYKINDQNKAIYERNVKLLSSVVETVILCGKQNISLRGHRDDSTSVAANKGNFLAILHLLASHDKDIADHLKTTKKNATYTSKSIQNEIIQIIATHLREQITERLKRGKGFYSIIADEVTDTYSNKEILTVCLRFVDTRDKQAVIREEFFDFVDLNRATGEAIANTIVDTLTENGIPMVNMRGQAYDGAAAMASDKKGCQRRIKEINSLALYVHCRSHVLNLSIASACKLPLVRNMIDVLNSTFLFFDKSPKRQGFLEFVLDSDCSEYPKKKLVGLCKTRWVERHACYDTFYHLYVYIVKCLQYIVNPDMNEATDEDWAWDRDTKITAQGLLSSMTNFTILMTFIFVRQVLDTVKPLTVKLQKRDVDISKANDLITDHINRISDIRRDIDQEFENIYKDAETIADTLGIQIKTPRITNRQQHRANVESCSTKGYYKTAMAIPFVDYLLQELNTRFNADDSVAYSISTLLPPNVVDISKSEIDKLSQKLMFWESDLDCLSEKDLAFEITEWQRYCQGMGEKCATFGDLITTFNAVDEDIYPNLHTLLHIGCVLPVSTSEAERSFSGLRRIKNYMRSTMHEDRLAGLALMHLHSSVDIDTPTIVEKFVKSGNRRLFQSSLFL